MRYVYSCCPYPFQPVKNPPSNYCNRYRRKIGKKWNRIVKNVFRSSQTKICPLADPSPIQFSLWPAARSLADKVILGYEHDQSSCACLHIHMCASVYMAKMCENRMDRRDPGRMRRHGGTGGEHPESSGSSCSLSNKESLVATMTTLARSSPPRQEQEEQLPKSDVVIVLSLCVCKRACGRFAAIVVSVFDFQQRRSGFSLP